MQVEVVHHCMHSIIMFSSLPLFVFIFALSPTGASSDLVSLLAFKSGLNDPLGSLISWNHATHFCNWTGIRCGRRHPDRVVGISLSSRGLVGSLSPHVGNLSFLRVISLQNNTLRGPIPREIWLLRRLEAVDFSNNSFTGAISKNLSLCSSLVSLNLIDNQLSGPIPTELGSMFKLEALGLGSNKLSGSIPPSIGNMTSMMVLSLVFCGLKGEIPASLARLQRLRLLLLRQNNFTGIIPAALFNLSAIDTFDVSSNQLQGVIPSSTLPNLVFISMTENQFSGRIPASMSNASLLQFLLLGQNHFTGPLPRTFGKLTHLRRAIFSTNLIEDDINIISTLTNCTILEGFQVTTNLFTGSLPNTIANLSSHFRLLLLAENKIHGRIPPAIGNLITLTVLDLVRNNLEGPIPDTNAKLSNLHYFNAAENRLSDALPSSFGNLTSLLKLYLSQNNLSGKLPPSIGNCTNLLELYLSSNNFISLIPPEIMSISSLSIGLDLAYNMFEGSIPVEVASLNNLGGLDLSYNRLSGTIPTSLRSCLSLEHLYLTGNSLQGEIPSDLGGLLGLQVLDLSQNDLSGPIPAFLAKMNLVNLNLSFNKLEGVVPTAGIFKNITSVSLDGNKDLCGGVSDLKLPPCPLPQSDKKRLSTSLKILIPILAVAGMCLILFAACTYKQRMSRKKNVTPSLPSFTGIQIMRLSYADLVKATGGFSEANLLGFGRFGSVYKGILNDGLTEIAVKVLNMFVRGATRSFLAECTALRNVRHRNLLKILSVCESIDFQGNEFKALVYEFKANGSLEKWLHQNAESNSDLDMKKRLSIAIDIAEGIEYLHSGTELCVVHGDLKPSNILLDEDMTAYVGDFGLAKIVSDILPSQEISNSTTTGIRGTIGYVPPEYGTSSPVSTQGDAYSYGIVLLEMFTNIRPTDDLFLLDDHVNLHSFASAALPDRVMEVVDPLFLQTCKNNKIKDGLSSILRVGVSCSMEIPKNRISMTEVVHELHKIRKILYT